mmetsp:Transcript_74235/g.172208  ORF Transcript_74235/g.172208 Transcript_74235/m.172208 type:complete len:274 (+) Transcript_74235:1759-2580(+)
MRGPMSSTLETSLAIGSMASLRRSVFASATSTRSCSSARCCSRASLRSSVCFSLSAFLFLSSNIRAQRWEALLSTFSLSSFSLVKELPSAAASASSTCLTSTDRHSSVSGSAASTRWKTARRVTAARTSSFRAASSSLRFSANSCCLRSSSSFRSCASAHLCSSWRRVSSSYRCASSSRRRSSASWSSQPQLSPTPCSSSTYCAVAPSTASASSATATSPGLPQPFSKALPAPFLPFSPFLARFLLMISDSTFFNLDSNVHRSSASRWRSSTS